MFLRKKVRKVDFFEVMLYLFLHFLYLFHHTKGQFQDYKKAPKKLILGAAEDVVKQLNNSHKSSSDIMQTVHDAFTLFWTWPFNPSRIVAQLVLIYPCCTAYSCK